RPSPTRLESPADAHAGRVTSMTHDDAASLNGRRQRSFVLSLRAMGLAACLVGQLGCQPHLPELEAQGLRVSVGVQADVELCAGTLRAWDQHVGFVEAELGIARDPAKRVEVYVVEDTAPWCDDVMACYIGGWVDASFVPTYAPKAIWHE